jgi:putative addiction module component (TIGR02574 family)
MTVPFDQLRTLPVREKLQLVEQLWDDIGTADEAVTLRDWHQEEAALRLGELESNPDLALTREELWRQVDDGNA